MLKFMKGKGQHTNAERAKLQKELFDFKKTNSHGFPHRPCALAWDPKLCVMAIGASSGVVRIYGACGVQFHCQMTGNIVQLMFIQNQGRLICHCDDNSLHLLEINKKNDKWELEEVKSVSLEGQLKKITKCCVDSTGSTVLIGTVSGDIYTLDVNSFDITENVIYQNVVMQNVPDDYKISPGSVKVLAEQPHNPDNILIGYNSGLMVLFNNKTLTTENNFVGNEQLECVSWNRSGTEFVSSHGDGSYVMWNTSNPSKLAQNATTLYGPYACKTIPKIMWNTAKSRDDFIIFAGGLARSSHGDKNSVTILNGSKHQVLDFTSKVIDFFVIRDIDDETDFDNPHTLVVLVEEELVAVDLSSDNWLPYQLPYLVSPHSSAITCAHHYTDVPEALWNKIVAAGKKSNNGKYTDREWPISGGKNTVSKETSFGLFITGHEDGTLRFWDASGVSMNHLYSVNTSSLFVTEDHEVNTGDEEEWPPFKKVGVFDPYSDDPRFSVKKISLCLNTGTLVVGGTAGQVFVMEMKDSEKEIEIEATNISLVQDCDNFVWKGHDPLEVRKGKQKYDEGFQPTCLIQLSPPASVSAIALHTEWGLCSAGTAHGFALFDYMQKKTVIEKSTLNVPDLSPGDGKTKPKSLRKSLRQSFRRLRRKKRTAKSQTPPPSADTSTLSKEGSAETAEQGEQVAATPEKAAESSSPEAKSEEKPLIERGNDEAIKSVVRCLYFSQSFIINSVMTTPTLWAGTGTGTIYIYTITLPANEVRNSELVKCQLGKEIQLKHRAPVLAIQIVDSKGYPLPDPLDIQNQRSKPADLSGPHRVLICSEEQFKVFTLPNLKPYRKYKLTTHEGSKARQIDFASYTSKSDEKYQEYCMMCLTNLGDVGVYSILDLHRQLVQHCINQEDINGISSFVFSRTGEGFYLASPSEFQCISTSAKHFVSITCEVALPEDARPHPPVENGTVEEMEEGKEKASTEEKEQENSEKNVNDIEKDESNVQETQEPEKKRSRHYG